MRKKSPSNPKPTPKSTKPSPESGKKLTAEHIETFGNLHDAGGFTSPHAQPTECFEATIFGYFIGLGVDPQHLTPRILGLLSNDDVDDLAKAVRIVNGKTQPLKVGVVVAAVKSFHRECLYVCANAKGVVVDVCASDKKTFKVCWFDDDGEVNGKCFVTADDVEVEDEDVEDDTDGTVGLNRGQ